MVRTRNLILAAAALTAVAMSPSAALAAQGAAAAGKSSAIIGRSSALAQILANQGAAPRAEAVRPSGMAMRRTLQAVPGITRAAPAFSPDSPNVFGTVALKVGRTSLDDKWRSAGHERVSGDAAAYAASLQDLDKRARLETINRYVNDRVKFVDDSRVHGRADSWATANETLDRGAGDCEDYAVAKLQMLRASGFADSDLYLVVLKDLVRRSDHAVAVVRLGNEMLVLDNGTDQILQSEAITDYRPIVSFAFDGSWTHGYRLASAPAGSETAIVDEVAPSVPAPAGRR